MKDKIRVVAAIVHQESNEVEIIIEKTTNKKNSVLEEETLHSIWIDCESELAIPNFEEEM